MVKFKKDNNSESFSLLELVKKNLVYLVTGFISLVLVILLTILLTLNAVDKASKRNVEPPDPSNITTETLDDINNNLIRIGLNASNSLGALVDHVYTVYSLNYDDNHLYVSYDASVASLHILMFVTFDSEYHGNIDNELADLNSASNYTAQSVVKLQYEGSVNFITNELFLDTIAANPKGMVANDSIKDYFFGLNKKEGIYSSIANVYQEKGHSGFNTDYLTNTPTNNNYYYAYLNYLYGE